MAALLVSLQKLTEMRIDDIIVYTTPQGTRTYIVVHTQVINETDFSLLGWSHENMITLITCERGVATQRFAVVAVEVR